MPAGTVMLEPSADLEADIGFGKRNADLIEIGRIKPDIKRFLGWLVDQKGGTQNKRNGNDPTPANASRRFRPRELKFLII
jgi:hypothetical protein